MINGDSIANIREQAYVLQSFPAVSLTAIAQVPPFWPRDNTPFSQSIMLIKLLLGQPLEALRSSDDPIDKDGKVDILTDRCTARQQIEAAYKEAGIRYGDAVGRCLHCESDQRSADLEVDSFREAVYNRAVALLEDDVKGFVQR